MKNNKYAPYILAPVLLLVWGLIFYKIYQAVYGVGGDFSMPKFEILPVFDGPQQDSAYALLLDYKDPFFGKHFSTQNTQRNAGASASRNKQPKTSIPKNNKTKVAPVPPPVQVKPFPPIRYQGFQIMETDTIAVLKINNRFIPIARKGQVTEGVQVLGIYPDSIQLQFEGQQKTFPRVIR